MKNSYLIPLLAASAGLLLAGCATTTQTTYVPQGSNKVIVETGKINIQDFEQAAGEMVKSLIDNYVSKGKLRSAAAGEPALLAISRIKNSTGQQLEINLLVKKITVELNKTGLVETSTTMGLGGPEDPLAADQQKLKDFLEDKKHARLPDYTLSGNIIAQQARAGNTRQMSYIFDLSLSSSSGVAVWEDTKTINKQGKRPSIGM